MLMIQFEAAQSNSDVREPVFFLAEDVVSIRGGGGAWAGKVTLVKTIYKDVPEMAILGNVTDVSAQIMAARQLITTATQAEQVQS